MPSYDDWLKSTWTSATAFSDASDENSNGVTSKTKSVALKDPVQYSVACLKTGVKCSSNNLTDNAKEITKDYNSAAIEDQSITVPNDGYKLRAILIGGQPASVNWDFYAANTANFDHTIYDKDLNVTNSETGGEKYMSVTTSSSSNYNYTLVLDNKNSNTTNTTQPAVYVTLEFENNGDAFYGADGLVPKNGRFYLVGKLDPSATSGVTKPEDSRLDRVFVQDHTTTANFTIKNLKNAYNCIPDLRAAGVNVGLAVDLSWQEGITFGVDI